jgi:hypothetical protein
VKFLTIGTIKDIFYTLPQAEQSKLMVETVKELLAQKKKMGDKWHLYSAAGWNRIIGIGEYNSLEELSQALQTPAAQAGYMNLETYPLIDMDVKALKAWIDSQKPPKKK